MQFANYGIPIITMFSSLVIILILENISILFTPNSIYYKTLSQLGKASMIIMFLHQWIQVRISSNLSNNHNIRFVLSVIIAYFIYYFILRLGIGRALFLVSYNDFKKYKLFKWSNKVKNLKIEIDKKCKFKHNPSPYLLNNLI